MPAETLFTVPLAKDWITKLWKHWSTIRESRRQELEEIRNLFGNPELLARSYIEPDCQRTNPADHDEDEPQHSFRQPIHKWLSPFLKGEFRERDGRNVLFVLSDAGMGKSSLLMMLKLTHMMHFWPDGLDFQLLKLGPETLEAVEALKSRSKTVLLLDALDEDETAWGLIEERLDDLLHATKSFRQVIITCRTQFFPEGGETPYERPEKVEVAGFVCNLIYLSPFSDEQVEAYLQKRFPNSWMVRLRKLATKSDNAQLEDARGLVRPMRSLRMRPMLLSHIDVLLESEATGLTEFSVYDTLIDCWLLREERKIRGGPTREQLRDACMAVAMYLQTGGKRTLSEDELRELAESVPEAELIQEIDVGGRSLLNLTSDRSYRFAHYSIQEFLVARRLVTDERKAEGEILRGTDQLLRFLYSWACEAPRERFPEIPWARLDCSGVKALGDVGLAGADLSGVTMPQFLRGVDLSGADLRRADLRVADLREADLREADLREAQLGGVKLDGARLQGAQLDPQTRNGIEFVFVPGGKFVLGANDIGDASKPVHTVELSQFWIAKYPLTNEQYGRFLEATDHRKPEHWSEKKFNKPDQPVVGVSWHDAMAYCSWAGFELPTEAQWEAAARGTDGHRYPWGDDHPSRELANYDSNEGATTPVGAYPKGAGPYGTLDQAGNVWEWCRDEFAAQAYRGRDGKKDPVVLGKDDSDETADRVLRGGAWFDPSGDLPSAIRGGDRAGDRDRSFGFRVLCGSVPEP